MKKLLALFLALVMCSSLFLFACGEEEQKKTAGGAETATQQAGDPNATYDAEVRDLQGHDFAFLVRTTTSKHLDTNEVYSEALTGDKVGDAVYKRNNELQQKFNCTISEERVTNPVDSQREALLAGDYTYDFIYAHLKGVRSLAASGLAADLNKLENINLNKIWHDQNFRKGLEISGKLFSITGDAGTLDDRSTWVMFFNKDILEDNRQPSPYELVKKGEWTVQKMYEISEACAKDVDGDGLIATRKKDVFGYLGEAGNNWYHVAACGLSVSRMTNAGVLEIPSSPTEEILDAWAALKPLLTSPKRNVLDTGFTGGYAAFFGCNLGCTINLANGGNNFGILPMPKKDTNQAEYWTSLSGTLCNSYCIPVTVDQMEEAAAAGFKGEHAGQEMCAYFLEAYSYYSMKYLTPAFYDDMLCHQLATDVESVECLEIALKNKVYDPVMLYDFGGMLSAFKQAGSGTSNFGTDMNYDNLVSLYKARLEAARKQLKNYLDYLNDIDALENAGL